jgi:lysozyme family protein
VHHPSWDGWQIIDTVKRAAGFPESLAKLPTLRDLVASFYKTNFWDRLSGDMLPPPLAARLFNVAVNVGCHRAVLWLQQALNVLNRNGRDYPDLVEDGIIGRNTITTLHRYLANDGPDLLVLVYGILQGAHYLEYMRRSPAQEKYARGWLKRTALHTKTPMF